MRIAQSFKFTRNIQTYTNYTNVHVSYANEVDRNNLNYNYNL